MGSHLKDSIYQYRFLVFISQRLNSVSNKQILAKKNIAGAAQGIQFM